MSTFNIAVIVGSARQGSLNRALAEAMVKLAGDRFAATFVRIDDLPLYNQDLEAPPPPAVERFKAEIEAADGVLVVTPEHNRSIPALLKNAIDWGARPYGRNSWMGKPVAITGASPGVISTALAQAHLRMVLGVLGALVLGGEAYLAAKPGLIDDTGAIGDESARGFLGAYLDRFTDLVGRLTGNAEVRAAA
jgi:chromate reductase